VNDARQRGDRLRRFAGRSRVLPLTALGLRARTVRESDAFVARELLQRHGTFPYTLRENGLRVLVRHAGRADPITLGEVFHERDYAPPLDLAGMTPATVVDLGANVGYFGAFALALWPGASLVAYEPDPQNAAVHGRTIALNGLEDRWELRRAAAGAEDGRLRFSASGDALSHLGDEGGELVDVEDVLPLLAGAVLVKIDVEGGEWPILADPRFAESPPRVVVLEYHPRGAPGPDPRAAVLELLERAGLTATAPIFDREDGHGMLWAWRP
jgi:FkbM family methyltransferase